MSVARSLGSSWETYLLCCIAALTLVFWTLNPSVSEELGQGERFAFWLSHVALAVGLLRFSQIALQKFAALDSLPAILQVIVAGLLGAVFFTPFAVGLDAVFVRFGSLSPDPEETWFMTGVTEFSSFVVPLTFTWLLINAPLLFALGQPEGLSAAEDRDQETPVSVPVEEGAERVWGRLPPALGNDVVAFSAELHYLRVYTSRGNTLILHAFSSAVDQMAEATSGVAGMQIHRSHWVALSHVTGISKDGEKVFCDLDNGLQLPVSRPFRPELRAAVKKGPMEPGA